MSRWAVDSWQLAGDPRPHAVVTSSWLGRGLLSTANCQLSTERAQ